MSKKPGSKGENVQVILRVRPLNKKELEAGNKDCVQIDLSENAVFVDGAGVDGRAWAFDSVYNNSFAQKDVYLQSIHPVVETVLQGYNATIFAYGQSGTGKTYSMCGNLTKPSEYGIIPHALDHIFSTISEMRSERHEYYCQASFVELYNGKCRDLLVDGKTNLDLKENVQKLFYVKDLSMHEISNTLQAMTLMESGITRREVKSTDLNSDSSRSHSLFTVYVKTWDKEQDLRTEAKLNLVDLAGSERQSKTGATGDTMKEGNNINLSLTALGGVIDCLVKGKPHIPYRSSPLTMLLKDGLGGNSRTVIVGTIGPADSNSSETVSTLRFIDRAKQIKNKPKVQMDPKDARIAELQDEVRKLRKQLGLEEDAEDSTEDASGPVATASPPDKKRRVTLVDDEMEKLRRRIEELEVQVESANQASEAAQQTVDFTESKDKQMQEKFKEREAELLSAIDHMKDRNELTIADSSDSAMQLEQLTTMVTDFLVALDVDKQWVPTVKNTSPSKRRRSFMKSTSSSGQFDDHPAEVLCPTVDDISRGLKMVQTKGGGDMKLMAARRMSNLNLLEKTPGQTPRNPQPPKSGEEKPFARPAGTVTPQTGEGFADCGSESEFAEKVSKKKKDKKDKKEKKEAPTPDVLPSPTPAGGSAPPGDDDDMMLDPAAAKKKKKDKKDKKEKKERTASNNFVSLEQRAVLAVLPNDIVAAAIATAGLPSAAKEVIDSLLAQQRASLLSAFRARSNEHAESPEAAELVENKLHAAELLVAFAQLEDEVEMLHDTLAKQKSQANKARAVAEKKILEVTQLKEHIDALRDELSGKDKKHQQDLAEQQDRMVQQFNKKMENFVAKQQKNLHRDKKAREQMEAKVEELNTQIGELEQAYDLKILEYDTLQRDYEQIKLENLRRFREQANGAAMNESTVLPERMRNVVNSVVVLDKLTGKSQVQKAEEQRPMPNTAGPLPSIGRKVLF